MSSDLTFLTNELGKSLLDRFQALLGMNTKAFDCLVGYFMISGFHKLYPALEQTEKVRILIGLKTDQRTYELLQEAKAQGELLLKSHAEVKEELPAEVLDELEHANDSAQVEQGIEKFISWVKSGKLQIKVYPSAKIHAKVYIMTFVDGDRDAGRIVTGSSNFSQSGFLDNLEFNVELKNRSDYEFALNKFNELWADAVEVSKTYVDTIELKSPFAQFTPYELYLKCLYEYFKSELSHEQEPESPYLPARFKKLKYQDDAVTGARKILEEYGGVFISDVVGLGKTYMSAMLAQQLDGRTLVLAPPTLLDKNNPGSWPNVFGDFRVYAEFESVGKLDDVLRRDVSKYDNIIIDESHRFRTETNETYEKLAQICRGKRVILVSATPLNNSPRDILSQIKLFQNGKNSTIPNVRNLEAFFGNLEKRLKNLDRQDDRDEYFGAVQDNAREIREKVLKYLMIRRTRSEIFKYYGADLLAQGLSFPEVVNPEPLFYEFNAHENQVFDNTVQLLTVDFTYSRYRPLTYYEGERSENALTGQQNLARFMKVLLIKRLESSFHAFKLTVDRFINSYERFIAEFHNGNVYISKKHINKIFDLLEYDDLEAVQRLIEADHAQRLDASEFRDDFIRDLESDLSILRKVQAAWATILRDPKWEKLSATLTSSSSLNGNKLILFTESKETAEYLSSKIADDLHKKVLLFSGSSDKATRDLVIKNFDARAFQPEDNYRILVTTEVLSEGVNLHRSNTVINYDIPWNPTRLIQRVGRVNRVDTDFDAIYTYNFFPTEQSNDLIKLKEAAEAKIHAFIEMLGADARLLTEGEVIKSHDLFKKLSSKQTITGEDETEKSELEYLKVIRDIRDLQPDLFERIKRLPKKARSAKKHSVGTVSLLTYFRKDKLEKFFISDSAKGQAREIDFMTAAETLKSEPKTPRGQIGDNFYPLLDSNKAAFEFATSEASAVEDTGRDNSAKILRRLRTREIRTFKGFTDEDEDFIKQVIRLLEDGALPRPTTKKVYGAVKDEISPLKILGILKRDVSAHFLRPTRAEQSRFSQASREVILSEYLIPQ
jgi:superfamily II DNA/RNA helicase